MKILHVNDHYNRVGGAETILFNVLNALEEQGIENVIVHQYPTTVKADGRRRYSVSDLGSAESWRNRHVADQFQEIVHQEEPDLIHIHDIGNPDIAAISHRVRPTVQSVLNHNVYCPGGAKYLPFLGRICNRSLGVGCIASAFLTHCNSVRPGILASSYRRSYRMMRANRNLVFIALSQYQAKCLIESGYPPDLVKILPPFTNPPETNGTNAEALDEKMLLFVGRVVPQKGLHVLLQSLRFVKSGFRLVVDGDGPDLKKAKELACRFRLEDRIDFAGWSPQQQHFSHYRQASMVIVPSIWPEPFGLVGIEAMSYAKPVVAFSVGGIPEWLEDGVTGFLIKPNDIKKMAEKINYLLENPAAAHEMGLRGREKVKREFTQEKYMMKLMEIYKQVIEEWGSINKSLAFEN